MTAPPTPPVGEDDPLYMLNRIGELAFQMGGSPLDGEHHPNVGAITDWLNRIVAAQGKEQARGVCLWSQLGDTRRHYAATCRDTDQTTWMRLGTVQQFAVCPYCGRPIALKQEKGTPTPPRVTHMKQGDTTVCGAAKVRGNSFYEWAYVNCPECRAQSQEKGPTTP